MREPYKDEHVKKHENSKQKKFHRLIIEDARANYQSYNQVTARDCQLENKLFIQFVDN